MSKGFVRKFFPLLAVLFLTPWPVAYAYDGGDSEYEAIQVQAAESAVAPSIVAFPGTIGGVKSGDLFYIQAGGYPVDILATLHLTNTDELIHGFRYLTLKVGVYIPSSSNQWQKAWGSSGETIPDTYLTLQNGQASFNLPGGTEYKITIDGGCFYYIGTSSGAASPQFYLTVDSRQG